MNIIPQMPVSNPKFMSLLPDKNDINIFALMPRTFTITTQNSSGIFNIDMLLITSSVISEFLKENPNSLQYHLDIKDEKNILSKFENIYQGKLIEICDDDISTCEEITQQLNLNDFPSRMKPSDLNSSYKFSFITGFSYYNLFDRLYTYKINQTSFINYLRRGNFLNRFTIQTNQNEYKCNIFSVLLSSVIRDFILKNPKSDRFIFDFEEEDNEFQTICDLFNFKQIKLTKDNSEIIKEIAEELGIDSILDKTNDFIEINERFSKEIDNQQNLIKKIDEIFELLFNIDKKTVDFVTNSILNSEWSKNEENIYELAALILNVVKANSYLHKYIVDLLIKLNENDRLTILLPLIIQNSINYLRYSVDKKIIQFIYQLYKRKLISKAKIMMNLEQINYNNKCINSWFLPELIELENKGQIKIDLNSENLQKIAHKMNLNIYKYCYPLSIEKYKEIRDKDEDDDTLLKAIREDDIDTFQSIVSQNLKFFLKKNIESMFESEMSYINYAAKFGSIKCFKFMLLNNAKIDVKTIKNAIIGGNSELIRIVDNKLKELEKNDYKQFLDYINEALKSAIKMHRNDLFDWIFDSYSNVSLFSLFVFSIDECNTYSLVRILDKGFAFIDHITDYSNFLESSMKLGYYSLMKFLIKLIGENMNKVILNNIECYVFFGNTFIFKKFEENLGKLHIIDIFYKAIKLGFLNIIEYIFEKYFSQVSKFKKLDAKILLENCILSNSNEILNYIIDKIEKYGVDDVESLLTICSKSYKTNNFEAIKSISELIYRKNPNIDFTTVLIEAIKKKNKDSIKYFIDNKYLIYGDFVVSENEVIKSIDMEIFHILINNLNYTARMKLMNCIDDAIMVCNIPLIEYLLKEDNAPIENSLLNAVEINDFSIVEMILKKNCEPSYVNKCSEKGTALNIAVANGNLEIVKKLLSVPGIDSSIGDNATNIPLIKSILLNQLKIFESIVNFYGEDIKNQKWQIEKCFQYHKLINLQSSTEKQSFSQILINIIKLNIIDLNYRFENQTLLIFAFKKQLFDVAEELIKNEKVDVNLIDLETGNSPLILAIIARYHLYEKIIDQLITDLINHKSINLNHKNYKGMSALLYAVQFKGSEIVDEIVKSDKLNQNEKDINFAFYFSNSYDIAKQLLTYKLVDVNYVPFEIPNNYVEINKLKFVRTPLMKAVINNDVELFELIARHKTFDKVKSQYENAYFISIFYDKQNILRKFLEIFKEIDINSPLINGNSPLIETTSKKSGFSNILEVILNDPNFDSKKSNIVKAFTLAIKLNKKYKTLYDFDSQHDHLIDQEIEKGGSSLLLNDDLSKESFDFLISHGVDPNKPSKDGIYPLEYIIQNNKKELFNLLIDSNKIDFAKKILNKSDKSEYTTYLHLIASLGRDAMLHKFLSKKLCDINITDDLGDTPLIEACRCTQKRSIDKLFKMDDLDFLHRNNNGEDALEVLIKNTNPTSSVKNMENIKNKDEYYSKLIQCFKNSNKNQENKKKFGDKNNNKFQEIKKEIKYSVNSQENKFNFDFSQTENNGSESNDINSKQLQQNMDSSNSESKVKTQSELKKSPQLSEIVFNFNKKDAQESESNDKTENRLNKMNWKPEIKLNLGKPSNSDSQSRQPQLPPEIKLNLGKPSNSDSQSRQPQLPPEIKLNFCKKDNSDSQSRQPQLPSEIKLNFGKPSNSDIQSKQPQLPPEIKLNLGKPSNSNSQSKQPQLPSEIKLNFGKPDNPDSQSEDKNSTESNNPPAPSEIKFNSGKPSNPDSQSEDLNSASHQQLPFPSETKFNFCKQGNSDTQSKDKNSTESKSPNLLSEIKFNFSKKNNSEIEFSKTKGLNNPFSHNKNNDSNQPTIFNSTENQQNKIHNEKNQFESFLSENSKKTLHFSISKSRTIFSNEIEKSSPQSKFSTYNESFSEKPDQTLPLFTNKQNQSLKKNHSINNNEIHRKIEDSLDEEKICDSISRLKKREDVNYSADSLFDGDNENDQIQYYQQPFVNNSKMTYLQQQQQQQWLQMIQMNNQLQAQINFQLMNLSAFEQKKKKQSKKKKKKNNK